jgi:hypothetical protein
MSLSTIDGVEEVVGGGGGGGGDQTTADATVLTTATGTIDSVAAATNRAIEWLVQVTDSTAGTYSSCKVVATHDGAAATATQYGIVGAFVAYTVDATYNAGNIDLDVTNNGPNTVTVKVRRISVAA